MRRFSRMTSAAALGVALLGAAPMLQAQEVLKIGAIGSLSGGGTAWGLATQRGAQMAIDEVNAAGGLKVGGKTYKPTLVMVDDQYTASGGRTAAQRLMTLEKTKFILGPVGTPVVLAAIAVTNPGKTLVMSDGYADTVLKNAAHAAYNFRIMDSETEFARAMIEWLHRSQPQLKTVALIAPNDATGQAVLPVLKQLYEENGFKVYIETFDRGMQEFTPLLTRMMEQKPDLFDLNANSPGDAGLLVKQARQVGFKGVIWKVGGPAMPEIQSVAGNLAEGVMAYGQFDFSTPAGQKFADEYHKRWSGTINPETPIWYNAAKLLMEAIRRAGTVSDVDKVRDAVAHLDGYDGGVFGPVVWGGMVDYGVDHQLELPFVISQIKGGKVVTLTKIQPEKR
ncbi:MAG TPA: ABC transporter substrate-binding protein [Paraburkholderia sp.]